MSNNIPATFLESFNETDVREEIIAPFLRQLGYRSGTAHNIIREQSLRYPKSFLGRKKPKTDPALRGIADYILEINKRLRWIIEAKAPGEPLDNDAIEQAFTYAIHPEVRAVYFALCNGHTLVVYRTDQAPDAQPLLTQTYEDLTTHTDQLDNLLSPHALMRDFPHTAPDTGPPLGPGLRSLARITSGRFHYTPDAEASPLFNDLAHTITNGAIERTEDGHLALFVNTQAPLRSLQELTERLKLDRFEMTSDSTTLSTNPDEPTTFTYEMIVTFPAGETLPNFTTGESVQLTTNVTSTVRTTARGTLQGRTFAGTFTIHVTLDNNISASTHGTFQAHLS